MKIQIVKKAIVNSKPIAFCLTYVDEGFQNKR